MTPADRLDAMVVLGLDGPDVGCDTCFELIDCYVEAQHADVELAAAFPGMCEHLLGCPACAQEAASILDLLVDPPQVQPPDRA